MMVDTDWICEQSAITRVWTSSNEVTLELVEIEDVSGLTDTPSVMEGKLEPIACVVCWTEMLWASLTDGSDDEVDILEAIGDTDKMLTKPETEPD